MTAHVPSKGEKMSLSNDDKGKKSRSQASAAEQSRQLRIEIDQETAGGVYSNLAMINHSQWEFVLDFIFMQPHRTQAAVRSRIITSPAHFKRLVKAMEDNLTRYEREFGAIPEDQIPDPPDPGTLN